MEKSTTEETFRKFAEERLHNHLVEINTLYENEEPDAGERKEAGKVHQQIFKNELEGKIFELGSDKSAELEPIKSEYLNKLI